MLWVAIGDTCNDIYQKLIRTISYFGLTIGDNTGKIVDLPHLREDCGPLQRTAGDSELSGIGFQLALTLPEVTFGISGWKKQDLLVQLRSIVTCKSKFQLPLETLYVVVGRLMWVRCNSYLYMPHFGVLQSALVKMLATRSKCWTFMRDSQIWRECVTMLNFLEQKWILVMPSIVRPWRKFAVYTDATLQIVPCNAQYRLSPWWQLGREYVSRRRRQCVVARSRANVSQV